LVAGGDAVAGLGAFAGVIMSAGGLGAGTELSFVRGAALSLLCTRAILVGAFVAVVSAAC
jgi:hypothetical protein